MSEPALIRAICLAACSKCGVEKPLEQFAIGNKKNGRSAWCKQCFAADARHRYSLNREKEIERSTRWNKKNKKKVAANMQRCRDKRPEFYLDYVRKYRKNNPDRAAIFDANKMAKRRSSINSTVNKITKDEWSHIKERHGDRCFYCNKKKKLEMDHYHPLSRGGDHSSSNIVPACKSCNSSKNAHMPAEFASRRGRLFW